MSTSSFCICARACSSACPTELDFAAEAAASACAPRSSAVSCFEASLSCSLMPRRREISSSSSRAFRRESASSCSLDARLALYSEILLSMLSSEFCRWRSTCLMSTSSFCICVRARSSACPTALAFAAEAAASACALWSSAVSCFEASLSCSLTPRTREISSSTSCAFRRQFASSCSSDVSLALYSFALSCMSSNASVF